jgi:hypothetical protein
VSGNAKSPELPPLPVTSGDDLGFYKELAFALKSNAVKPDDKALFAQFARIGLTTDGFDESKLSPDMRRGVVRALADGPAVVVSSFASTATVRNGWNWVTGLDSFGFNYPLRAIHAHAVTTCGTGYTSHPSNRRTAPYSMHLISKVKAACWPASAIDWGGATPARCRRTGP